MDCLIEKVQGLLDDDEPGEGTSGVTAVQGLEFKCNICASRFKHKNLLIIKQIN